MKKTLFLVAMASLAMASCSKDETTSINRGRSIDFRATLSKGTRATEITTATLDSFYCTALNGDVQHFGDVQFSKEDGFFTSATDYYWPSDGSELKFYAYAPSKLSIGGTFTIDKNSQKVANFQPKAKIGDQVDFIAAYTTGDKATNEETGVALNFKHTLAQVGIKAKNGGDKVVKVQAVGIREIVGVGDYAFTTNTWTPSSNTSAKSDYNTEDLPAVITLAEEAVDLMGAGKNAMLIPQQLIAWTPDTDKTNAENGAWLAVKINLTNASGKVLYPRNGGADDYAWVGIPIDTKWEAGKKYIYTLDFSNGAGYIDPDDPDNPGDWGDAAPIKFTVSVGDWVEAPVDIEA